MPEVKCITIDGRVKIIPSDRLTFRPAAYALILHDGKILLLKMRYTGKYHLPGGGIQIGERMEDTLKRETREETGIDVDVVRFVHFEEIFFYYDPSDRAYHGLHFYFLCKPNTFSLLADNQVNDDSAEHPRWVDMQGLRPEDFQIHGDRILELCRGVALSGG